MFALDILNQLQNENGSLLSDGRIYVYYLGRTRLADIYNDIDGQIPLSNPVILDNLGMSEIYLSNAYDYTVVVTDPYGTELFSRDIFTSPLQEGGANARLYEGWDPIVVNNNVNVISAKMANLGVESPLYFAEDSESATVIGISGEFGKTYSGIDPIVVNNELNKISANTKTLSAETPLYITDYDDKTVISVQSAVLGVESPLYFVENSETATVIGIQGSAVNPEGAMYESAFGYEDGKITGYNGSGFSAGNSYEAGNYIDIDGNIISVTGVQPSGDYAYNSALSSKLDTSSFSSISGDFLTAIPDEYATKEYVISSVSSKLDVSSFSSISGDWLTKESADTLYQPTGNYQTAGDYYSASNPSAFVTSGELSVISGEITGMIPTGEYLTKESADTLYQPIGDYLTTADSGNFYTTANESGFVTNSEVINNYINLSSISGSDGQITSINGSALPGGITYTGVEPIVVNNNEAKISANTIGITGISPIEIIESNNSLVVSANLSGYATTGQLASVSGDITAMIPTALTGEYLTKESADTLYQPIGNYQTAGNYVSASELTAYATTSLVSSVSSTITGMLPTGDFELVAGAGIELVDDPNEHTTTINVTAQGGNPEVEQAVIDNSATWDSVTAKQDSLTFGYKDTAISSIDNSALYDNSAHARITTLAGRISDLSSNKLDTTAFSDVSGTFLTAHQDLSDYQTTAGMTAYANSAIIIGGTGLYGLTTAGWSIINTGATYTSPSGTILIRGNTLEASNSAVATIGSEGFVSSFENQLVGPQIVAGTVHFSWDESLPNTVFNFDIGWVEGTRKLFYSANTNLTGEIILPTGITTNSIAVPNATALDCWVDIDGGGWLSMFNNVVSAADTVETVVGELAWASALPTYEYDNTNKISAINGSALAGGAAGVSGTNVIFVPEDEDADYGRYYSATVSGDVIVTTGHYYDNGATIMPGRNYSLSSIGGDIGNKLDKNKIEDSNTIAIINNHAEVTDKAYRTTGFTDISAHYISTQNGLSVEFNADYAIPGASLYSAIIIAETTASGSYVPNNWTLVSYENNSAIFTKYYPLQRRGDDFELSVGYGGWGYFTNCEASATVYTALEIAPLAFKDDITGITYTTGSI